MAPAKAAMRTPLGKVRGHGAGHGGTGHFIAQRVSAVALLILAPWFAVTAALTMPDPGYVSAIDFLSQPLNAVGVILLLVAGLYHMRLGMQVIVEDYIQKPVAKALVLVGSALVIIALGAGAIFAVLNVNFGV
jgi:succinate dehydrogenase / fumarate reductase, membrane anchor subunit